MIYIFSNKNRCKFFFALILLLTLFLFFRLHRKLKISYFFLFRSNPYICISSKSEAKQCAEISTATKSLPITRLIVLYALSISRLKENLSFL